jgi:type III restriction enzyme
LSGIKASETHAGYFSIDKKKHFTDSKISDKRENISDDADAYDLIMRDKERLLDLKEPVRFIFSHSALREGWDNPNVFQICTLKQSGSDVRKRQEVGRGLRLCVNNNGDRMDVNVLGTDVHNVNVLTVVANESYDSFAKRLQTEIAEVVADRPREVTSDLFENKSIFNTEGKEPIIIDHKTASKITHGLIKNGYLDDDNALTDKYYEDVNKGTLDIAQELEPYKSDIIKILGTVYNPEQYEIDNGNKNNISNACVNPDKLKMKEFKELWSKINSQSAYIVNFDTDELVKKAIASLDTNLHVSQIVYKIEQGEMKQIKSKQALINGEAFVKNTSDVSKVDAQVNSNVKYDLVGKISGETQLTRKTVVEILSKIQKSTFDQFKKNPEEFIIKASEIIQEQKATIIIEHITYNKLEGAYDTSIFTDVKINGQLGKNAIQLNKHLFDYFVYGSTTEKDFAEELDKSGEVAVYVKLPGGFTIKTPVGNYNPDWAIAFHKVKVKHIYFIAETKGDLSTLQFREVESLKIHCAREHFKAISSDNVKYDVVHTYKDLLDRVMK